jgi:hypothetical protein
MVPKSLFSKLFSPVTFAGFKIPLFIGSFVDVKIPGRQLADVVRIPAKALRDRDTVWVRSDLVRGDVFGCY